MLNWFLLASCALFIGTLGFIQIGFVLGKRAISAGIPKSDLSMNAIEAFAFSILSLILGFSFSYASGRLDQRRELAVAEANAIGTSYLRLDFVREPDRTAIKRLFLSYIDSRLEFNRALADEAHPRDVERKSTEIQNQIWAALTVATRDENPAARVTIYPPVNEMIDLSASRSIAAETRTPSAVIGLIVVLSLLCATIAGRAIAMHGWYHWVHRLVFAAVVSATFLTILDLNDARSGWISIDYVDRLLRDMRTHAQEEVGQAPPRFSVRP